MSILAYEKMVVSLTEMKTEKEIGTLTRCRMEKGRRDHKFRCGYVEIEVFRRPLDISVAFEVIKMDMIT